MTESTKVSRLHSKLARAALWSVIPLLALSIIGYKWLAHTYWITPATIFHARVFDELEGRWAVKDEAGACLTSWEEIRFSSDHRVMTLRRSRADSLASYDVQTFTQKPLRVVIRDRGMVTPDDRQEVWYLVLHSSNRMTWHRVDWPARRYTELERCPDLI